MCVSIYVCLGHQTGKEIMTWIQSNVLHIIGKQKGTLTGKRKGTNCKRSWEKGEDIEVQE